MNLTLLRRAALTPTAQALLEAFQQHARDQHWHEEVRRLATRNPRILLAFHSAHAPIPQADVRALQADRPGTSARRVVQFLAERGLLTPDPTRQLDSPVRPPALLARPGWQVAAARRWRPHGVSAKQAWSWPGLAGRG